MKLAFYKTQELNEISKEFFSSEGTAVSCEVGYSEKLGCDAVEVYDNSVLLKTVAIQDLITQIGEHVDISITHFDVIEVGDFGEGFAFFF